MTLIRPKTLVLLLVGAGSLCASMAAQQILPTLHDAEFPVSGDPVEIPRTPRLELPGGEGTIEFWATPAWTSSGGPTFRCVIANGRTVYRPTRQGADKFSKFFEARYAVYLKRNSILLQFGDELHEVALADFTGSDPFSGRPTHFAIATKGQQTAIYVDGRSSILLDVGYGDSSGSVVTIGDLPEGVTGIIRQRKNNVDFHEYDAADPGTFGPFRGRLGGVRIWDTRLDSSILATNNPSGISVTAPVQLYGEFHAARDITFGDQLSRANLVAYSRFRPDDFSVHLADRIAGNWINTNQQEERLSPTPEELQEFQPITNIDDRKALTFVSAPGSGEPASIYTAYLDGELAGTLVRHEIDGERRFDFLALDGSSYPASLDESGDSLYIEGVVTELGEEIGGFTELIRPTARAKGVAIEGSNPFLAELRVENITHSLKSYDLRQLHPFEFWRGGSRYTGSDQWIFDDAYQNEMELAKDSNSIIPIGFKVVKGGQSGGNASGTTVTTEREVFNAVRAKFGIQGGSPKMASGGANVEFTGSEAYKTLATSATTLANSWGISTTVILDPLYIRLSTTFLADIDKLLEYEVPYSGDDRFKTFIEKWGTHYPRAVSHGGMVYSQRTLNESDITGTSEWSLDAGAFVQTGSSQDPSSKVEASGGATNRTTERAMESMERSSWSGSGVATLATNADMIVAEVNPKLAVPVSMDLRMLHELLSPAYFEDARIYQGLRAELGTAILGYLSDGEAPSRVPAFEIPSPSLELRVAVKQFRHDANDDDGSSGEFRGHIQSVAYSDLTRETVLDDGGLATSPAVLWKWGADPKDWAVDADGGWAAFNTAPGAREAYDEGKGKHSYVTGVGELTYKVNLEEISLEDMGIELEFHSMMERDNGILFDSHDVFNDGELVLREADFRGDDGEFASSEFPEKRIVRLGEKSGDDWVEFEVWCWVRSQVHPWRNPSEAAQRALERALKESTPRTRSRGALDLAAAAGVESASALAYFPFDMDGLRRPGARYWDGEGLVGGVDMSNFTLVFDLLPADAHFEIRVGPADGSEAEGKRSVSVRHGAFFGVTEDQTKPLREIRARIAELVSAGPGSVVGLLEGDAKKHAQEKFAEDVSALRRERTTLQESFRDEWLLTAEADLGSLDFVVRDGNQEILIEDAAPVAQDTWYCIGLTLRPSELEWVVFERDSRRLVAQGLEELPGCLPGAIDVLIHDEVIGHPWTPQRGSMDELYLFDAALPAHEVEQVAGAPRAPAPPMVRPIAYWPFDSQRSSAPAQLTFQGTLGRVIDDGLTLLPTPERLSPPLLDLRDFTVAFDFRTTDSTRTIVLEDALELFELTVFNDGRGLQVSIGPRESALAMRIPDYVPVPYEWQRVVLSFNGLETHLTVDDGSGWNQTESGLIPTSIRDELVEQLSGRGREPIAWDVRATYHFPGTTLAASAGYAPPATSELALADELRFWSGAMDPARMARAMHAPRRFEPPSQETRLAGYYPFGNPGSGKAVGDETLLQQLVSPVQRGLHKNAVSGLSSDQVVEAALVVPTKKPLTLETEDMPYSDFTLHLDFLPGNGQLTVRGGPIRFTCDSGRTQLSIDSGDDTPWQYDPAFGDRLAGDLWHKLVLAVDSWDSSLQVFLDGESFGRVPLTRPVVDALRAADAGPRRWRFEATPTQGSEAVPPAMVDELIFLAPALGTFELEVLAARWREPAGDAPPRRMRRASGLASLDPRSSQLRSEDSLLADHIVAYFPLDAGQQESSGRGGEPLASPGPDRKVNRLHEDRALVVDAPLLAELPGLDLDSFTVSTWFAARAPGTTLLSMPGATLRMGRSTPRLREMIEEVARLGRLPEEALVGAMDDLGQAKSMARALLFKAPGDFTKEELAAMTEVQRSNLLTPVEAQLRKQYVSNQLSASDRTTMSTLLIMINAFRGMHVLEIVLESQDGRLVTANVEYAAEPKAHYFLSLPPEEYIEGLVESRGGATYRADTWQSILLSMDVVGGELRGTLNGRPIQPIQLPKDFRLKSPLGSAPRLVGVAGSKEAPANVRLDELIVLDGTPLPSSLLFEYLIQRPRTPR